MSREMLFASTVSRGCLLVEIVFDVRVRVNDEKKEKKRDM